jgi:hypothetical protein
MSSNKTRQLRQVFNDVYDCNNDLNDRSCDFEFLHQFPLSSYLIITREKALKCGGTPRCLSIPNRFVLRAKKASQSTDFWENLKGRI